MSLRQSCFVSSVSSVLAACYDVGKAPCKAGQFLFLALAPHSGTNQSAARPRLDRSYVRIGEVWGLSISRSEEIACFLLRDSIGSIIGSARHSLGGNVVMVDNWRMKCLVILRFLTYFSLGWPFFVSYPWAQVSCFLSVCFNEVVCISLPLSLSCCVLTTSAPNEHIWIVSFLLNIEMPCKVVSMWPSLMCRQLSLHVLEITYQGNCFNATVDSMNNLLSKLWNGQFD